MIEMHADAVLFRGLLQHPQPFRHHFLADAVPGNNRDPILLFFVAHREFPCALPAGDIPGGSIDKIDEATWRHAWELKVFGYINLTRAIYAQMKSRGHGVIVNDIGAAGEKFDTNYIAGSAGNAALMAFTRALGS